jgi:effector-binding domain-containing protein
MDALCMNAYFVTTENRPAQPAAVRTATLTIDCLPEWLGQTFGAVAGFLPAHNSYPVGPPFARYSRRADGLFDVAAGFPVQAPIEGDGDVEAITLPGGPAATTMHVGPYDDMVPGYQAITDWITSQNAAPVGDPWEVYLSDPGAQPDPAQWQTQIVQPYRSAPSTTSSS